MKGKEIFKRSKGITLIALVITIIVLLILAGVTIATLTGDNGLLTKASGARDTSTEAEIEEKLRLAYQDYYLGQHTQAGYTFQNAVDKMFGTGVATVTEANGLYKVTFTNGKKYTFNALTKELAILEEIWTQDGTIVTNTKTGQTLEVGDTVYYDSGVQAYEGTGDNQGKWGILGAEDGNLLIQSKESLGTVTLEGKEGYLNGSTLLNNACSPYKNSIYADLARCPKVEDIYKIGKYTQGESTTYTFTGNIKFEDVYGKKLPDDDPISVVSNYYDDGYAPDVSNKVLNFLNGTGGIYFLASQLIYAEQYPPYVEYAAWGLKIWQGSIDKMYLWNSSSGAENVCTTFRGVVSLKPNVQLSGSSADGWTLQVQ